LGEVQAAHAPPSRRQSKREAGSLAEKPKEAVRLLTSPDGPEAMAVSMPGGGGEKVSTNCGRWPAVACSRALKSVPSLESAGRPKA
jgi:hypothetical protein